MNHLSSGTKKSHARAMAPYRLLLTLLVMKTNGNMTTYNYATVRGRKMFYREAGNKDAPTIVLLHGFPSSSHMFRDLIPKLSDRFHVIAPDYIGFGYSDAPNTKEFEYTFDNLAEHVEELLFSVLGLKKFSIYVQDYGAPVGYRIASKHQDAIEGIVVQNGNAYLEGIGEAFNPMKPFWSDRNAETEKPVRGLLTKETTVFQYTHGVKDPRRISPDAYTFDQFLLATARATTPFSSTFFITINRMSHFTTDGTITSGPNNRACSSSGERTIHSSPWKERRPINGTFLTRNCT
jgi:pimeloyl-ACP methyl ester carboxylesterase